MLQPYNSVENVPVWEYNYTELLLVKYSQMEEDMNLLTTTEMADKWNITRRRVAEYCKAGRIEGAVLKGKTWLLPEDAKKPEDPRKRNDTTCCEEESL